MKKIITDFSFGEISPKFDGRADLPYYTKGCSELRNMYVMPQGVAGRIGGTEIYSHAAKIKVLDYEGIIIPFYYNETKKGVVRMIQPKGYASVDMDIVFENSTTAASGSFTWAQDLSDVQWAQVNTSSGASIFFTHPDAKPLLLEWDGISSPTLSHPTFTAGAGEETFSATGHYPSVCSYIAGRLIFGATATNPDMLWMSKTLNPKNFTLGNNDADAIALHITTSDFNQILWAKPKDEGLAVGTTTTETMITGGDNGLTPTSLLQTKISTYGSSHTDPIQVGLSTIFVQSDGRRLREIAYTDAEGALASPDISLLAEHLTESGVKRMTYQLAPFEAIFILRNDGKVAMLSYDRTTGTNAWSLLDLDCDVLDICTLDNRVHFLTVRDNKIQLERLKPYEDNPRYIMGEFTCYNTMGSTIYDRTWYWDSGTLTYVTGNFSPRPTIIPSTGDKIMVTQDATLAGRKKPVGVYTVEVIDQYTVKLLDEDGNYVTSPLTSWSGIGVFPMTQDIRIEFDSGVGPAWYTEFDVFVEGEYQGKISVDNFLMMHLPVAAYRVTVGHSFSSHMKTMRIVQEAIGNPVSRISKVYLRLWKSLGCKIGESLEDSEEITFRDGALDLGTPELFTGDKEHTLLTGYNNTGYFYVWTDDVHPLNICAMAIDYRSGGQRQ